MLQSLCAPFHTCSMSRGQLGPNQVGHKDQDGVHDDLRVLIDRGASHGSKGVCGGIAGGENPTDPGEKIRVGQVE